MKKAILKCLFYRMYYTLNYNFDHSKTSFWEDLQCTSCFQFNKFLCIFFFFKYCMLKSLCCNSCLCNFFICFVFQLLVPYISPCLYTFVSDIRKSMLNLPAELLFSVTFWPVSFVIIACIFCENCVKLLEVLNQNWLYLSDLMLSKNNCFSSQHLIK